MAVTGPDFYGFDRALILRSIGMSAEARKQAAAALFASLCLQAVEPEDVSGIVLWDELTANPRGLAR